MKRQTWVRTPLWLTIALLICCLITAWLAVHGFYYSLFVALCLTAFVAYAIYRYILRSARAMAQFIWSVRYSEFLSSPTSNPNATPPLPEELLTEMQDALEYYRSNLQKKESELQYFQALANHIDMAILVYTPDGQIEWINDATKRLIHINRPHTVNDLIDFHPELPAKLRTLKAGDLSVWQIKQEEETVQFALSSMEFIIQGRKLLIAGMKNIHSALDNRETEAWQKLIRVLTHEIMNSTGLESRFNRYLHFDDYTLDEMLEIFKMQCRKSQYTLSPDAEQDVKDFIYDENADGVTFGNARGVRNLFEQILTAQANRLAKMESFTKEDLMTPHARRCPPRPRHGRQHDRRRARSKSSRKKGRIKKEGRAASFLFYFVVTLPWRRALPSAYPWGRRAFQASRGPRPPRPCAQAGGRPSNT